MTVNITIPEILIKKAKELGIDLEVFILETLARELKIDPLEEAKIHIRIAEKFFKEAKENLIRQDPLQTSEKLYKVAEECIKALALKFNLPEVKEAKKEGRWWTKLLSRSAKKLTTLINEQTINLGWSVAYELHVWGFHEASLDIEHIKVCIDPIRKLLEKTKRLILNYS